MAQRSSARENPHSLFELEQKRLNLLKSVEEARLQLAHQFTEKRLQLLAKYKPNVEWLLSSLSDIRKERVSFEKKGIAEVWEALVEAKIPEEQIKPWLADLHRFYHEDLSLAEKLLAADVSEFDLKSFDQLRDAIEESLRAVVDAQVQSAIAREQAAVMSSDPRSKT
jgi:hypothetical protein